MRDMAKRITTLEAQQRQGQVVNHFISVLRTPWGLSSEDTGAWIEAQLAYDCSPECPGKAVGLVMSEMAPDGQAWEDWVARESRTHRSRSKRPSMDGGRAIRADSPPTPRDVDSG
jgi:hypothetical protein